MFQNVCDDNKTTVIAFESKRNPVELSSKQFFLTEMVAFKYFTNMD